ncbi:MAG: rod shape-determining protein MreC [Actinobacteria bacterium]|nr:MAG: rod shape-determining protein MreC [Actinomycetota bacterium]
MFYRQSSFRNRIIIVLLVVVCILLITFYYKQRNEGLIQASKNLTVSLVSSVQIGASKVFSPVRNGLNYLSGLGSAKSQNVELKAKLSKAKSQINQYRAAALENERLRKLLNLPTRKQYKTLAAIVIGVSSNSWEDYVTIDKGLSDGVKRKMPVITSDGLIGQISIASANASLVQLITDSKSGVAAEVLGSSDRGLIEGNLSGKLSLDYVDKTAKISKGDTVVTSGLGGVFPKGLLVGKVSLIKSSPSDLYKRVEVTSDVDFTRLGEVLVLKSPLPPDTSALERLR